MQQPFLSPFERVDFLLQPFFLTYCSQFSSLCHSIDFVLHPTHSSQQLRIFYLDGRWRPLLARGGGGQSGGGLDVGGGHLGRHGGRGAGAASARGHVAHQAHAAIYLDVAVALRSHVEHLQAIVVETRQLALVGPLAVIAADGDGGLGVEDGQLTTWSGGWGGAEQRGRGVV